MSERDASRPWSRAALLTISLLLFCCGARVSIGVLPERIADSGAPESDATSGDLFDAFCCSAPDAPLDLADSGPSEDAFVDFDAPFDLDSGGGELDAAPD